MSRKAIVLVGLAIFVFILLSLDLPKIINILLQANVLLVLVAVLIAFVTAIIKAFRWKIITSHTGIKLTLPTSIKFFLIGFFISAITPARVGEFVRAIYISKSKKDLGSALSTVVFDRIIDVVFLVCFGIVAVIAFSAIFNKLLISFEIMVLLLVLLIVGAYILFSRNIVRLVAKPFYKILIPQSYKKNLRLSFDTFYGALNTMRRSKALLSWSFALTMVSWMLTIFAVYLLLIAINIEGVPLSFAAIIVPIISLVDLIPITISGLGTREASVIFLLSTYAVSAETAVALSILIFVANYLSVILVGGLFFVKEPLKGERLFKNLQD